jgi:hypothetical protein
MDGIPGDTLVGGLVSNFQVAELIACMAKNRSTAYFLLHAIVTTGTFLYVSMA